MILMVSVLMLMILSDSTVVRNQSPMLLLKRMALVALL